MAQMTPIPDTPDKPAPRAPLWFTAALLACGVLTAIVHAPAIDAHAVGFDDLGYVQENPYVLHPTVARACEFLTEWRHPPMVRGYPHPLAMISLMLDTTIGGNDVPDAYRAIHRTNVLLHAANTMLVASLLYAITGNLLASVLVALLFGVHPLTVEPVVWIAQRKTLMAAFFALLSLRLYITYARRQSIRWFVPTVLTYLAAVASKPTAIPLPIAMLLLDAWPLRRLHARALIEKLPFLAIAAVAGWLTVLTNSEATNRAPRTLATFVHTLCDQIGLYTIGMFWPTQLSITYPAPNPNDWITTRILLGAAIIVIAVFAAFVTYHRTRAPAACLAIFVVLLAPTIGVVPFGRCYIFDNYLYLPVIGLLILLASGLARAPRAMILLPIVPVIALAGASRAYLADWRSTESLYRHCVASWPDSDAAKMTLGWALAQQGHWHQAIDSYRRALALDPRNADTHYNLGVALAHTGHPDEAVEHYRRAIQLEPTHSLAQNNIGNYLLEHNKPDRAIRHYRMAVLELCPPNLAAMYNLGMTLADLGHDTEAVAWLERRLAFGEADAPLHMQLALAYGRLGEGPKAVQHARQALALAPDDPQMLRAMAWLLATSPQAARCANEDAIALAQRANERTGGRQPLMLAALAAAYAAAGRFDDAIHTATHARDLARSLDQPALAASIERHLTSYAARMPLREVTTAAKPPEQ